MFVERSAFHRDLVFAPTAIIGLIAQNKRPAVICGPSGGLLWIDQEVVTLRGLFGNSGFPDRPESGGINPYSPVVCGL